MSLLPSRSPITTEGRCVLIGCCRLLCSKAWLADAILNHTSSVSSGLTSTSENRLQSSHNVAGFRWPVKVYVINAKRRHGGKSRSFPLGGLAVLLLVEAPNHHRAAGSEQEPQPWTFGRRLGCQVRTVCAHGEKLKNKCVPDGILVVFSWLTYL